MNAPISKRFGSLAIWGAASALLVAATGILAWQLLAPAAPETSAKNWKYVEQAAAFTQQQGGNRLAQVTKTGLVVPTSYLALSKDDVDVKLGDDLKQKAAAAQPQEVEKTFQQANVIPQVIEPKTNTPLPRAEPKLTLGLSEALSNGNADFVHLFIFDSCEEDGDVVEVIINNEPFAVVPITIQGATLSVPVVSLPTSIAVRGVRDGGGGITVAFQTSQGDFFARVMAEGEVAMVGLLEP